MHRTSGRAAALATTLALLAAVLIGPASSSAQTSTVASRTGFGYGFQVQLWHYDAVARSNVIGDVTQTGMNWMTQQIDWQEIEIAPGTYDFTQLDNLVGDGNRA